MDASNRFFPNTACINIAVYNLIFNVNVLFCLCYLLAAHMNISITPLRLLSTLIKIVCALVFCAVVTRLLFHYYKSPLIEELCYIFNLDEEHNIPALYSFFQLLAAAFLLALIARHAFKTKDGLSAYWCLMTILFFYIAFDELESFHERASLWLHQQFHTSGLFYFAWVVPAVVTLLILGIILLRFLRNLPLDSRKRFLIAGTVYITGAVGGDVIAGQYISMHGSGLGWPYVVEYHVEETMEMLGIAYFIYALLLYIRDSTTQPVIFTIKK